MTSVEEAFIAPHPHRMRAAVASFIRHKPLGAFGAFIIILLLIGAIFADVLAPYAYDDFDVSQRLNGPSWDHPFGMDPQGRDIFSRVIYGARTSVLVATGSLTIAMIGATLLGVTAGWFGGLWDLISQRIIEIWLALPGLVFLILLISIFGRSMTVLLIALGILFIAGSSRLVRSATLGIMGQQYVEAAKSLGASDVHVMVRHIVPNILPIVIVTFSIQVGSVIPDRIDAGVPRLRAGATIPLMGTNASGGAGEDPTEPSSGPLPRCRDRTCRIRVQRVWRCVA